MPIELFKYLLVVQKGKKVFINIPLKLDYFFLLYSLFIINKIRLLLVPC